jgi:hypothetical protein
MQEVFGLKGTVEGPPWSQTALSGLRRLYKSAANLNQIKDKEMVAEDGIEPPTRGFSILSDFAQDQ